MTTEQNNLYYDCPIEAAYMVQNFGVEIEAGYKDDKLGYIIKRGQYNNGDWFEIILDSRRSRLLAGYEQPDFYFVHPDSEHIFEPKEGDLVAGSSGDYYCTGHYVYDGGRLCGDVTVDKIIKRRDTSFITPLLMNDRKTPLKDFADEHGLRLAFTRDVATGGFYCAFEYLCILENSASDSHYFYSGRGTTEEDAADNYIEKISNKGGRVISADDYVAHVNRGKDIDIPMLCRLKGE